MPDGRIARFEVPVGTTPEQATSMFNSFLAQQEQPQRDVGIIESGVSGLKKLLSSQRTQYRYGRPHRNLGGGQAGSRNR